MSRVAKKQRGKALSPQKGEQGGKAAWGGGEVWVRGLGTRGAP